MLLPLQRRGPNGEQNIGFRRLTERSSSRNPPHFRPKSHDGETESPTRKVYGGANEIRTQRRIFHKERKLLLSL